MPERALRNRDAAIPNSSLVPTERDRNGRLRDVSTQRRRRPDDAPLHAGEDVIAFDSARGRPLLATRNNFTRKWRRSP
jgi:hypothetical protein